MSDLSGTDIAAIIAASASLVAAIGSAAAAFGTFWNGRKIEQIHKATNSMKDELVKVTGEAKFAEGVTQGEENPRAHRDNS